MGNNAGEPSIGIDWAPKVASLRNDANKTNTGGVAFFQSGNNTLRVSFDDRTVPSTALWEDKSAPTVQQFVLSDPIGFVDRQTGRVFSLDLVGGEGNSLAAFSDDDGNSWTPMQGGGSPAGPDHETLGGGPFTSGVSDSRDGWVAAVGIEWAFAGNWIGRVQYDHYDFGTKTYLVPALSNVSDTRVSLTVDTVRVGLSYKFGGPGPVVARY